MSKAPAGTESISLSATSSAGSAAAVSVFVTVDSTILVEVTVVLSIVVTVPVVISVDVVVTGVVSSDDSPHAEPIMPRTTRATTIFRAVSNFQILKKNPSS